METITALALAGQVKQGERIGVILANGRRVAGQVAETSGQGVTIHQVTTGRDRFVAWLDIQQAVRFDG